MKCGHGGILFTQMGNIPTGFPGTHIRPVAIGRKNFLFCNTVEGAPACATFYSLITTAKANGLSVGDYLLLLFHTLPTLPPGIDLTPLLTLNPKLKNTLTTLH